MSFEFFGGFLALDLLQKYGAPKEQAESVAEAIIRHQDLGDIGTISTVGQLIQLSTLFGTSNQIPPFINRVLIMMQITPAPIQPS
jgi:cyanamide hydratase